MFCEGGGNILESSKNLRKSTLSANGYFSPDALTLLVRGGRGRMPAYGAYISPVGNMIPSKLNEQEIEAVVSYVLEQSEDGWPPSKPDVEKNCDVYPGC